MTDTPKVGQSRVNTGNAGKGRVKGVPNKTTGKVKEMILAALDKKGGVDYLVEQADQNPVAFMALVGKVLPMQVTGEDGGPIKVTKIELISGGNSDS